LLRSCDPKCVALAVEVEVAGRPLLEPEPVVIRRVLEKLGCLLEHVLSIPLRGLRGLHVELGGLFAEMAGRIWSWRPRRDVAWRRRSCRRWRWLSGEMLTGSRLICVERLKRLLKIEWLVCVPRLGDFVVPGRLLLVLSRGVAQQLVIGRLDPIVVALVVGVGHRRHGFGLIHANVRRFVRRAANRSERLSLEALHLARVSAPAALQFEVLADRIVE
jgi:hypothetical protein